MYLINAVTASLRITDLLHPAEHVAHKGVALVSEVGLQYCYLGPVVGKSLKREVRKLSSTLHRVA